MRTVVILPAYNEEKTIKEVILDFHQELPNAEIFVINNNSKDNTEEIAKQTLQENNIQGKVINEMRQGKALAIRTAFHSIDADIYIMADADLTYPAKDIHKLIALVGADKADLVVGDRLSEGHYEQENKRKFHQFGNNLVKKMINFIFKSNLKDIMSGYRVMNRKFVKNYPILIKGFELETDMSLHALDKRFRILEVPINYQDRPEGSHSKLSTFKDGLKVLFTIIKIFKNYKPMSFFSIWTLIFFILSLSAGMPVILEFIRQKYITHIPLAILSTGLMVFSIISLTIGLILDTVAKNQKSNYELRLLDKND